MADLLRFSPFYVNKQFSDDFDMTEKKIKWPIHCDFFAFYVNNLTLWAW